MITKVDAKDRYRADHGWLTSYHLFSFAEYYDEGNMNFGVLRVFNDDTIDGESGFGTHGHRDMEIVTIMLEGALTHEDTMGNKATIQKGEVQYMSAGTGVMHSEVNQGKDSVHLYQLWFLPRKRGLTPTYAQKDFSGMERNILVPVVSGDNIPGVITISSDVTVYLSILEKDRSIVHSVEKGRGLFIYVTKGKIEVGGIVFTAGDQARIMEEITVTIYAHENSECVVIEVAQ